MDTERSLISIAVREGDLKPIIDANIKVDDFEDDEHREVYGWVLNQVDAYGEVPTAKALHNQFENYTLIRCEDPYKYYVDLKVVEIQKVRLWDAIEEARVAYQSGDVKGTADALSVGLQELYAVDSSTTKVDLTENTDERLDRYEELQNLPDGLRGVTTGLPSLDEITSGWRAEQLITLVGLPKGGKSTVLMSMAIAAQNAGHSVLFFSFEMSEEEQAMRYDAMRAGINYLHLETGKLSGGEQRALQRAVEGSQDFEPFLLEHDPSSALTVSALGSKIAQDPTDIVFVDGVYMMDAEIDAEPESARALTHITRGLKRLAMREKVPIVGSTQALLSKYSRSRGITLGTIGYTGSFGQDSDVIIAVDDTNEVDVIKLSVVGARNAPKRDIFVRRDWDTSTVEEHGEQPDWHADDEDDESSSDSF